MSGKGYTMKEMKCIVDYLTDQKAYSEVRARKMWMDFANTKLTNRTWQSLKETFLKRILPDIHNPYYKLNMDQIRSFRQGCDVEAKEKNRLVIRTESDDSNSNADSNKDEPSTSVNNKEADEPSGETIKSSQITSRNRSSAETVILDKCYETADEIRKDLESPKTDGDSENVSIKEKLQDKNSTAKSTTNFLNNFKQLPMSPTMQKLFEDFASEPETENELGLQDKGSESIKAVTEEKVPEDVPETETIILSSDVIVISEDITTNIIYQSSPSKDEDQQSNQTPFENLEVASDGDLIIIEDSCVQNVLDTNTIGNNIQAQDETQMPNSNGIDGQTLSNLTTTYISKRDGATCEKNETLVQNCSNTTTDASLPNNPEGLSKTDKSNDLNKSELSSDKTKSKKRSNSSDIVDVEKKKKKQTIETKKDEQIEPIKETNLQKIDTKQVGAPEDILVVQKEKEGSPKSHKITFNQDKSTDASRNLEHTDENENPCLKSVSLYDEQFNKLQYSGAEQSGDEIPTETIPKQSRKNVKDKDKSNFPKDVVMLKSHSEAGSDQNEPEAKIRQTTVVSTKIQRDKALANIFGFAGGVSSSRKRRSSHKKSSRHHYVCDNVSSESSEWTSQSDNEMYVSPPRGKKSRHTRKYLKPQSARVIALEEEGGLFVMHGKKIYPLIKDGKTVKNYLTYLPDSESEENETNWKQKYFEEKNKADELRKLLEQRSKQADTKDTAPVERIKFNRNSTSRPKSRQSTQSANHDQDKAVVVIDHDDDKVEEKKRDKQEKVKIKFTRNNEEVQLEGHWQQLHPVLEQVVQIFNKDSEHGDKPKPALKEPMQIEINSGMTTPVVVHPSDSAHNFNKDSENVDKPNPVLKVPVQVESNSGMSTPVLVHQSDPEVKEKIDQLEKEIFQEIEAMDRLEHIIEATQPQSNVTKRKAGRPRKVSSSTTPLQSPAKRLRSSKSAEPAQTLDKNRNNPVEEPPNDELVEPSKVQVTSNNKSEQTEDKNVSKAASTSTVNKLRKRSTSKNVGDATQKSDSTTFTVRQSRRSNTRQSETKSEEGTPSKKVTRASLKMDKIKKLSISENTRNKSQRSVEHPPMTSPPELSMNSIDSTQGYQDSDISPPNKLIKKKKKLNLSTLLYRGKRTSRRRTFSVPDMSSDSSNSSFNGPVRSNEIVNSSLNTDIYITESFELLIQKPRHSFVKLAKIDEACPVPNVIESAGNEKSTDESASKLNGDGTDSNHGQLEVGSSSNVSLPMSPELSIVERLSVTQEMIESSDEPTLNEINNNFVSDSANFENYVITAVDISVPLMEQDCGLEHTVNHHYSKVSIPKSSGVSESLLSKVCSVKIQDNSTMLRSLDQKLQELLLESAQKITVNKKSLTEDNEMEVDVTNSEIAKKVASKKRCSTPRKRKGVQKAEQPKVATVVEEEHTESYSRGGRQSCPPALNVLSNEMKVLNTDNASMQATVANKPKKQKKDVIKVKILRPKDKKGGNTSKNTTRMSINTDSGINDIELDISLNNTNNSVELIHNHSETCLQANECIGNSVEFIETSSHSAISVNSTSLASPDTQQSLFDFDGAENISPAWFCNNAQGVTNFKGIKSDPKNNSDIPGNEIYHSPLNTDVLNDSLLTEDLSDELPSQEHRPSKWYLLSEDETTSTNIGAGPFAPNNQLTSFGSNLKQIFPLTCAVPDLSTITEMSRENDDSRKPTLEGGDTRDDMDSQSLFY